jgi:hypothetical protein
MLLLSMLIEGGRESKLAMASRLATILSRHPSPSATCQMNNPWACFRRANEVMQDLVPGVYKALCLGSSLHSTRSNSPASSSPLEASTPSSPTQARKHEVRSRIYPLSRRRCHRVAYPGAQPPCRLQHHHGGYPDGPCLLLARAIYTCLTNHLTTIGDSAVISAEHPGQQYRHCQCAFPGAGRL